jgi:hypothetical protein
MPGVRRHPMNGPKDSIGDLLREFYDTFGMPNEGPPPGFNVTAFGDHVPPEELEILQRALSDDAARRQLRDCRALLNDLATRLKSEELLRELCGIPLPIGRDLEDLSSGSGLPWPEPSTSEKLAFP